MIFFNEERHEYRVDDAEQGEIFISATTLLGLFKTFEERYWKYYTALRRAMGMEKKEFSSFLIRRFGYDFKRKGTEDEKIGWLKEIAEQCAIFHEDLVNDIPEVTKEWKATSLVATDKGTKFHLIKEDEVYKGGGGEYDGIFHKVVNESHDLFNLAESVPVIIPELRMFNRKYKIAGSADMIKIFPDKTFDVDDWKTNKEIKMTNDYQKMKGPLSHLDDCNHIHYCLQISLYAYMLECFGYKPNNLRFTHVVLDEDGETILEQVEYHTTYMKKEIMDMLAYYEENKTELLKNLKK